MTRTATAAGSDRRVTLQTVVQRAAACPDAPDDVRIRRWAGAAFAAGGPRAGGDLALTVRLVGEPEAAALNQAYRGRPQATNVLSFPLYAPAPLATGLLGDLVICAPVVAREAAEQGKSPAAHWAHMVVHGVLHCCGFEHDSEAGALRMEGLETRLLADFGFPDPYTVADESERRTAE